MKKFITDQEKYVTAIDLVTAKKLAAEYAMGYIVEEVSNTKKKLVKIRPGKFAVQNNVHHSIVVTGPLESCVHKLASAKENYYTIVYFGKNKVEKINDSERRRINNLLKKEKVDETV